MDISSDSQKKLGTAFKILYVCKHVRIVMRYSTVLPAWSMTSSAMQQIFVEKAGKRSSSMNESQLV